MIRPLLLLIPFCMSSCIDSVSKSPSFDLQRLVGRWESTDVDTHQIEEWSSDENGNLKGKGYVVELGDTVFIEFLSIIKTDSIEVYKAQVSDQNNGEVIDFRRTAQGEDFIEFSNPQHDFPKKIVYRLQGDTALQAYIEGPRDERTIRVVSDFIKR